MMMVQCPYTTGRLYTGSCVSTKEGPLNQAGGWSEDLPEAVAQASFLNRKAVGLAFYKELLEL